MVSSAARWKDEIQRSKAVFKPWLDRCDRINKLYTRQFSTTARRFSLLWSNVQTLQPAVYARVPQAVVSRRYKDSDPVARTATEILERASNYTLDAFGFDQTMRQVRDDYLLYGRGTCWVRYVPEFESETLQDVTTGEDPDNGWELDANGEEAETDDETLTGESAETVETLKNESVAYDYVHRTDFLHSPARTWGEVWWVARRAFLTRDELIERFGEENGKKVGLDHTPPGFERDESNKESICKATVYEIWSKRDRKVVFVAEGYDDVLSEEEPFLDLKEFWPCPKPAYGTLTNDSLVPIPDYIFYQDQAEEIDTLTAKIAGMQDALKLVGFYPSGPSNDGSSAIKQAIAQQGVEVTLVPVSGWSGFQDGGGANQIQWVPLDQVVRAMDAAYQARTALVSDVYQITGISDIVRGDTNPNETATAQGIKAQWGSIRIRDRQMELARFARDVIQIVAEAIAEKFQPQTLQDMTGFPIAEAMDMPDEQLAMAEMQEDILRFRGALDLLRDDAMRGFRVDVESDSTIQADENEDKQRRIEFLTAMSQFLGQAVQAPPQIMPIVGEMLKFGIRGFRVGREMEDVVERTLDQIMQQANQPQQQGPDPAQIQAEVQAQALQQRTQADAQKQQLQLEGIQARTQADVMKAQADMQKTAMQTQASVIKNQSDIERAQAEAVLRSMPIVGPAI